MPRSGDQVLPSPSTPAELRARAVRYRELAKQHTGDVVADRLMEFAAELDERAAAMEKPAKPDGS
jgi:hypothetical protein